MWGLKSTAKAPQKKFFFSFFPQQVEPFSQLNPMGKRYFPFFSFPPFDK